ncbi:MAG TPA: 4Fe-4S binding protein [Anaerolineae bacterium]|nr:4Fe-4S binding protein [Anaerolineae bacterium]
MQALPLIGRLLVPLYRAEQNEAILLPIGQAIQGSESVVLPYPLLAPLVEGASARTILHECLCRHVEGCQDYPRDVGCLFLGDGAAQIDGELGQRATAEEALAHVGRAMSAGLMPTILHAALDAYLLDIPYCRMLTVCFCCNCCCTVRYGLRTGPQAFRDAVVRLPGLTVRVGEGCTGCGACLPVCDAEAMVLYDGRASTDRRASVDEAQCKGCGRCAAACPVGAIEVRVADEAEVLGGLYARIARRTEIGLAGEGAA